MTEDSLSPIPEETPVEEEKSSWWWSRWSWKKRVFIAILILNALGFAAAASFSCLPSTFVKERKYRSEKNLRIMTLNLAHGRGLALDQNLTTKGMIQSRLDVVAQFLKYYDPHIVGLQEVDQKAGWSGNFDHLKYLAKKTGYRYSYFGHNNRHNGWFQLNYGNGILSKYPITYSETVPFGRGWIGEKGFSYVELDVNGRTLPVVVVHFDFRDNPTLRVFQTRQLVSYLKKKTAGYGPDQLKPILLGDFNAELDKQGDSVELVLKEVPFYHRSRVYPGDLSTPTFPVYWPRYTLDYFFFPPEYKVVEARVLDAEISDHLPVMAEIQWPPDKKKTKKSSKK